MSDLTLETLGVAASSTALGFTPISTLGWESTSPEPREKGRVRSPLVLDAARSTTPWTGAAVVLGAPEEEWRRRRAKHRSREWPSAAAGRRSPSSSRHRIAPIVVGARPSARMSGRRRPIARPLSRSRPSASPLTLPSAPVSRGSAAELERSWTLTASSLAARLPRPCSAAAAAVGLPRRPTTTGRRSRAAVVPVRSVVAAMLAAEAVGATVSTEDATGIYHTQAARLAELNRAMRVAKAELAMARDATAGLHSDIFAVTAKAARMMKRTSARIRRPSSLQLGDVAPGSGNGDGGAAAAAAASARELEVDAERAQFIRSAVQDPVMCGRKLLVARTQVDARVVRLEGLRAELQVLLDAREHRRMQEATQRALLRKQYAVRKRARGSGARANHYSNDVHAHIVETHHAEVDASERRRAPRAARSSRRRASIRVRNARAADHGELKLVADELNARARAGDVAKVCELFSHGATSEGSGEHCADVNWRDAEGKTALIHAAIGGHFQIASLLVLKGAQINIADRTQCTALHHAFRLQKRSVNHAAILKLLKENGADGTLGNRENKRPRALRQCSVGAGRRGAPMGFGAGGGAGGSAGKRRGRAASAADVLETWDEEQMLAESTPQQEPASTQARAEASPSPRAAARGDRGRRGAPAPVATIAEESGPGAAGARSARRRGSGDRGAASESAGAEAEADADDDECFRPWATAPPSHSADNADSLAHAVAQTALGTTSAA